MRDHTIVSTTLTRYLMSIMVEQLSHHSVVGIFFPFEWGTIISTLRSCLLGMISLDKIIYYIFEDNLKEKCMTTSLFVRS